VDDWLELDLSDLAWEVSAKIEVRDGRPRLTGLRLDPKAGRDAVISSDTLRNFPIRQVLMAAQRAAYDQFASGNWSEKPRPGQKLSDEHLRFVAAAHAMALDTGSSPAQMIMTVWKVSRPTAQTWLRMARTRGFLGPSSSSRSGDAAERGRQL